MIPVGAVVGAVGAVVGETDNDKIKINEIKK